MIEEKLRKRLRRAAILVVCINLSLLVCGGIFSAYLRTARNQTMKEQVIAEAEEYKSRIMKQLRADFQTLSTLSVFLKDASYSDWDLLAERLQQTQKYTNFVNIVYYSRDGKGVLSNYEGSILTGAELSDLSAEGQAAVEKSLAGEASVSKLFESAISDRRVFVYSVPVYDGSEVIGALAASDHIEIFSDILSGNTVLGGGGYINLIDSKGDFLVRSPKTVVKDDISSIFDGPYLEGDSRKEVQEALQKEERTFSTFTYEGKKYSFLLEPVGLNNWYLFCVNTGDGLSAGTDNSVRIIQSIFITVLLLIVFLMIYGYRALRNYNKDLLFLAYHDTVTGAENMTRFIMVS